MPRNPSARALVRPLTRAGHDQRADVASELRYLVRSSEPAVVFSSLAHLCVPLFSDACTVDIAEHGQLAYRIVYHRSDVCAVDIARAEDLDRVVRAPFSSGPSTDSVGHGRDLAGDGSDVPAHGGIMAAYRGLMTHVWLSRNPDTADVARASILARHGVATVAEERLAAAVHSGYGTVEALLTNRNGAETLDAPDGWTRTVTERNVRRRTDRQPRCRGKP